MSDALAKTIEAAARNARNAGVDAVPLALTVDAALRVALALEIAERVAFKLTPDAVLIDLRDRYVEARDGRAL